MFFHYYYDDVVNNVSRLRDEVMNPNPCSHGALLLTKKNYGAGYKVLTLGGILLKLLDLHQITILEHLLLFQGTTSKKKQRERDKNKLLQAEKKARVPLTMREI